MAEQTLVVLIDVIVDDRLLTADLVRTLPECREVQLADCRTSLAGTLLDSVLRLLSPLM